MKFFRISSHLHLHFSQHTKVLLFFCWIVGIFLTFAIPPFQKPDEPVHYFKAISIASGNILCTKQNSGEYQNLVPRYLATFPEVMHTEAIAFNPNAAFPKRSFITALTTSSYDTSLVNEPSSCSLPFFLYTHLGIALSWAVQLRLNPLFIFYLGRLVNFVTAFLIFVYAIKKSPPALRSIPLVILMIPMTLHQMGSYSKDALHLGAGALVIAYILKRYSKHQYFSKIDYISFFVALITTILARPYYIGLSLLALLFIPENKVQNIRISSYTLLFFPLALALIIGILVSLNIYVAPQISYEEMIQYSSIMPGKQLEYMQTHPLTLASVLIQTLQEKIWFITTSFIGQFGWLDYSLQWYIYLFYGVILTSTFFIEKKQLPAIPIRGLLIIFFSILITCTALALSFYIYLTPVASPVIEGMQGRYFLILIPLFLLLLSELWYRYQKLFFYGMLALIAVSIFITSLSRYYSYDKYYYRQTTTTFDNASIVMMPLSTPATQLLSVDNGKQMNGFTVNIQEGKFPMNDAFRMGILSEDCQTVLAQKIFHAPLFQTNGDVYLTFKSISLVGMDTVCIRIEPYSNIDDNDEPLRIATDKYTKEILIAPLYLH